MRVLTLMFLTAALACGQPADWYWSSPLVGGGCNVCAHDEDGNLMASIPYNGTLSSMRMIKHADGSVWAADTGAFKLVQFVNTGNGLGLDIPVWMITNLCTDPSGNLWTSSGALFVPITIEKRDSNGALLPPPSSWTLPATAINVVDMRSDASGNIWIHAIDGLHRIDTAGVLTGPLTPGLAGTIMQMTVDHHDEVWTLVDDGVRVWLIHLDGNLNVLGQLMIDDAVDFALDGNGNPRVLRDIGTRQDLTYYTRSFNPVVTYQVSAISGTFGSIAIDWAANTWLAGLGGNGTEIFDCAGQSRGTIGGTPSAASTGDRTGLHLITVLNRAGDADGDGVNNDRELFLGADLLDPLKPPQLLASNPTPTLNEVITITMPTTDPQGYGYIIAASETQGGFEIVPQCQNVPLNPTDLLLAFWLDPVANFLATGVYGTLDVLGTGQSTVTIPDYPPIIGATFYFCGGTTDLGGLPSQVSPTLPVTVQ